MSTQLSVTMTTILLLLLTILLSSDGAAGMGSWSQVDLKRSPRPGALPSRRALSDKKTVPSWTPDPGELLGPYEDVTPQRDTKAYFMSSNNSEVTVQMGSTAALRCQVFQVAEHETVSWIRHRDHHIITLGSTTHSSDDRFQVTYEEKSQDWTLHIHYAQPRDSGVYECQLSTHPPIGLLTSLTVIEAAATIAGGPEMYVQVGSSVHLQCTIEKYTEPPTYVFWYQGERMINYDTRRQFSVMYDGGGSSELRLGRASASDSGNYSCFPSNAKPASIVIHVITGEAPAAMQSASASLLYHPLCVITLAWAMLLVFKTDMAFGGPLPAVTAKSLPQKSLLVSSSNCSNSSSCFSSTPSFLHSKPQSYVSLISISGTSTSSSPSTVFSR